MPYTLTINDKTYNILSSGFSLKNAVGEEGKHRSSTCAISVRGEDILSDVMYAENLVDAAVKDDKGNILFTGVIRPYASLKVNQTYLGDVSIEVLDYTEKLHLKVNEAPSDTEDRKDGLIYSDNWDGMKVCDPDDVSNSIVHKICALAGVTIIEAPVIRDSIFRFSLAYGDYLDEKLADLLYEYVYDYRFDENGNMIVFQSGPIVTGTDSAGEALVSELTSAGVIRTINNSLEIKRNDDKKDGSVVRYGKFATRENVQLFTETKKTWSVVGDYHNGWWTEKNRKITWDKSELNDIKAKDIILSNFWLEFTNETWGIGSTWLESKALSGCTQSEGYASWSVGYGGGILFNNIKARITIRADASYLLDDSGLCGYDGTNSESYTASYIFTLEKAAALAYTINARGKRSQFSYSFKSGEVLEPGKVYEIEELSVSGLSTKIRILTQEQTDVSGIYKYTAEGYGEVSFLAPTFEQEREEAKWAAMDMLELQLSKDEVVLKNDDPIKALASGLLIQKYGETPSWYLNDSPLNDETSVNLSITKDQLRIGPNILKLEVVHDGQTYKLERKISYITSDMVVKIEFTACDEGQSPDENNVWVTYQPQAVEGQVIWVRIMTSESTDWIVLRWTGYSGSNGVGVSSVVREYSVSTSNNIAPSGGWQETYPGKSNGEYVWIRDRYIYTDGTVAVTVPYVGSGFDGAVLAISSDLPAFRFDKNGEPYPDQVATITVNKQGIGADTEFEASNGMKVADNSSEIKVTPYSAGMAKLKLKNIVPTDKQAHTITRAESGVWLSCSVSIPSVANKKLYQRLTYWGNREFTQTESYTRLSLVPRPDRGKGKAYSSQKTVISDIFTGDTSSTNEYPFGYYLSNVTLESPLILNYEEGLLIDIGELEQAFPYFASLSDNEKKEILDTLPFFEDEFILGAPTENLNNNLYFENGYDGYYFEFLKDTAVKNIVDKELHVTYPPDADVCPAVNLNLSNKVTNGNFLFACAKIRVVSGNRSVNARPIDCKGWQYYDVGDSEYYDITSDGKKGYGLGVIYDKTNCHVISGWRNSEIAQANPIVTETTIAYWDMLAIDVTKTGWYTLFSLLGFSKSEIVTYLNEHIPIKEGLIDFPISAPLTITAVAGDYTDSIILSKVQDGADGEKGDKGDAGTPGQDGADAQLLLLSSDVPAFRFKADGTPYPGQMATVKVTKQGISQTTEFGASNGMAIEDNASEIKVTPYMLGASIKLRNFNTSNLTGESGLEGIDYYKWEQDSATGDGKGTIQIQHTTNYTVIDTCRSLDSDTESFMKALKNGVFVRVKISGITTNSENPKLYFSIANWHEGDNTWVWTSIYTRTFNISKNEDTIGYAYFSPEKIADLRNLANVAYERKCIFVRVMDLNKGETVSFSLSEVVYFTPPVPLEEAFPYFAGLSDDEKGDVLNTIPYFEDEFELCQTLENRCNPDKGIGSTSYYKKTDSIDYDPDSFTITFNYNNDPSITVPQYVFLGQDDLTHWPSDSAVVFYDRCEIDFISSPAVSETTQLNRIFGNEHWTHLSGNTPNEINVPIKQYENGFHKKSFLCFTSSTNGTPVFSYLKANQLPELDGSSLRLKNIVLINLTYLGWYLYFKLIGASDNEIYQWCENLPVFKDTYDMPISPLTITATAGDFSDSLSIGVVQDSEAVNFSISASPELYNMTSREYVKNEQIIRLDCVKTNYTADHQAVWTLSSTTGLAFSDESGGTEYSGTTRQADTVWVKVKEGCLLTSFKVTCSLEGLGERERTISASIPNFKPEYIQVVKAYKPDWSFPTSTADGPVKAGDMIIYVTKDADGVKQSTYRTFIGGDPSTASNWVSADMKNSENSQLMIDGLYDALMEKASNASVLDMVKQLVAQYIAAQFINISGAIFGGERYELQDDAVVDHGVGVGFYLGKDGILKAYGAELTNIIAENGTFSGKFASKGFETVDEVPAISSSSVESQYRDQWNNINTYADGDTIGGIPEFKYSITPQLLYGVATYENYVYIASYYNNIGILYFSSDFGRTWTSKNFNEIFISGIFADENGVIFNYSNDTLYKANHSLSSGSNVTGMPFYTDYTNLIKINDVYLAKQYITNNIWYTNDSSLASSTWKNISVSNANSVAYSNGKWYVAKFDGVSIDLYSGTSLSSLSKKTIDSYVSVLADYGYDYGFVDMLSDGKYLYFVAWTTNYNDTEHGFYIGCVDGDLSSIDFYDNIGDFLQDNIDGISDNLIVADLYRNTIVLRFPSTGLLFSISTDAVKESDYQSYSQTQNNDLKTEVDILKPLKCAYGKAGFVIPGKKAAFIYPHYDNKKVTNFFLSVKNKLLSTFSPAPVVEPLSYEHNVSGTFVDYDGSSKTITKMKLSQAGIIEITDSTGGKYKFGDTEKYPIEIKNLVISAEQPSINISDINPMNNEMDIGSDNNRVRKIYTNDLSGNVNEEGTDYQVWGAVFN